MPKILLCIVTDLTDNAILANERAKIERELKKNNFIIVKTLITKYEGTKETDYKEVQSVLSVHPEIEQIRFTRILNNKTGIYPKISVL